MERARALEERDRSPARGPVKQAAKGADGRRLATTLGNAAFARAVQRAVVARTNGHASPGTSSGTAPNALQSDVRQCMLAAWTQRQIGVTTHANWPEPNRRLTVSEQSFAVLRTWFLGLQTDPEMSRYYPPSQYRWEVATSATTHGVRDLKISPLDARGSTGAAIFNYHIAVAAPTT
jgi:hypothetical protein